MTDQINLFPPTRYMGSKSKLLNHIWESVKDFEFTTVLDPFAGSNIVSYLFKSKNKKVISNDYMRSNFISSTALIENNETILKDETLDLILNKPKEVDNFVQHKFKGLYFIDEDNIFIDRVRANLYHVTDKYEHAIALASLQRACVKKRARGIFTYTGFRYDDGRKDLKLSLEDQFIAATKAYNNAVFSNEKSNISLNKDALSLPSYKDALVYIDPPYYSLYSDNEYVRRYHFIEGLARDWQGVDIQENTKTKKFKSYPTPFTSKSGVYSAFNSLFERHKDSILLVSYSSNSLPALDEMTEMLSIYKQNVEVLEVNHKYSFGNQSHKINSNNNSTLEYLFLGY